MRIGVDARQMTAPPQSGLQTYTDTLVRGLMALDHENDYVLFADQLRDGAFASAGNVELHLVSRAGLVGDQLMLPLAMRKSALDIALLPSGICPLARTCRVIVTINNPVPMMPGRLRADHIITLSEASKASIHRLLGNPADSISVVPPGLHRDFRPSRDESHLSAVRERYQLPEQYILGFASNDPGKNLAVLLKSASMLADRLPDVGLTIVASQRINLRRLLEAADEEGARPCIVQKVPRKDLAGIYTMADALAFPYLYEWFKMPIIEAMACGTPVVVSNTTPMAEIAGGAALLVDPLDPTDLTNALVKVITDPDLRARLVTRGLERALEFSWRQMADRTVAVYQRVFAEPPSRARRQAAGGGST